MVYVYLLFPVLSNSWGSGMMNQTLLAPRFLVRAFLVRLRSSPQSSSTANSAATRTWQRPKWVCHLVICCLLHCSSQMQHNINISKKMHCAVHMSKNSKWIYELNRIHAPNSLQQKSGNNTKNMHTYAICTAFRTLSAHISYIISVLPSSPNHGILNCVYQMTSVNFYQSMSIFILIHTCVR